MTIDEAVRIVRDKFPFEGYMAPQMDAYRNIARTVLRLLHVGARILDFGAGPCDKTAILQTLGFECFAYDDLQDEWHKVEGNREKIINFARDFGITYEVALHDKLPFQKNTFDMIMMHDILEHLHDSPRVLLNDLLELAKPDGYLFITVPSLVNIRKRIHVLFGRTNLPQFRGYYWYPGKWRGHIREYTKTDLELLSEYLSLEIIELRGCHHMLSKLPKLVRPIYLCVTGVFNGWRDSWLLVGKKKTGWKSSKHLPKSKLAEILRISSSYQYKGEELYS